MSGATVTLGYGKANLSAIYASFSSMKVQAPFARVSAVSSGVAKGPSNTTMVGNNEIRGVLVNRNVEHALGTVILLQSSWKVNGSPTRDGAIFLRLRVGAPLYNILAYVPTGVETICGDTFTMFSGYADILDADELEHVGIAVNNSYVRNFMEAEEIDECFQITQVTSETIPRPGLVEIESAEGPVMREIAQGAHRRIIVRRR